MYKVKEELKPSGLTGISDKQINDHWKLYEGYVKQVNGLSKNRGPQSRYGFEYNGMILHELYFGNLTNTLSPLTDGPLKDAIVKTWGSFDSWQEDFVKTGKTRGIGWAILYVNPETKALMNHFISSHEIGHIAGFIPLLVMDVWEHAYMVDHNAGGRGDYIGAFLQNVHWSAVEGRYSPSSA